MKICTCMSGRRSDAFVMERWGRKVIPDWAEAQCDLFSAPVWPSGLEVLEVYALVSYSESHLFYITQNSVIWALIAQLKSKALL